MAASSSIAQLRIYQLSWKLEDHIGGLLRKIPPQDYFQLGHRLRRKSTAISHYITDCHERYSYALKLEALHFARKAAEELLISLDEYSSKEYGDTKQARAETTAVIKQIWGLIKYLKARQDEKNRISARESVDQLVAARQ